jgi:hypothetical protein
MHCHISMKRELIYKMYKMYKMSSDTSHVNTESCPENLTPKPQNIIKKYNKCISSS